MESKTFDACPPGRQFRQGDLLIEKVDCAPEGEFVECPGGLVLAEGEATGHRHVLEGRDIFVCREFELKIIPVEICLPGGVVETTYRRGPAVVDLRSAAKLVHPEHGSIHLEAGTYSVTRQQQYGSRWGGVDVDD